MWLDEATGAVASQPQVCRGCGNRWADHPMGHGVRCSAYVAGPDDSGVSCAPDLDAQPSPREGAWWSLIWRVLLVLVAGWLVVMIPLWQNQNRVDQLHLIQTQPHQMATVVDVQPNSVEVELESGVRGPLVNDSGAGLQVGDQLEVVVDRVDSVSPDILATDVDPRPWRASQWALDYLFTLGTAVFFLAFAQAFSRRRLGAIRALLRRPTGDGHVLVQAVERRETTLASSRSSRPKYRLDVTITPVRPDPVTPGRWVRSGPDQRWPIEPPPARIHPGVILPVQFYPHGWLVGLTQPYRLLPAKALAPPAQPARTPWEVWAQ